MDRNCFKSVCSVLVASLACLILTQCDRTVPSSVGAGPSWPRWRGPNGDGVSTETGWNPKALEGGPRVSWETDIGVGFSSVTVQGSHVYAMGGKGDNYVIWCLNKDNGKPIWQYKHPSGFREPQATPTVEGDSVYALGKEGILFCLGGANGKLRWKKDLVADCSAVAPYYGFSGSPVIEGDLVLVTTNTAGMAINKKTGQLVWGSEPAPPKLPNRGAYWTTGTGYSTPVIQEVDGRRRALFASWKGVCAVALDTGTPQWLHAWGFYTAGQGGDPVVVDGKVLLTSDAARAGEPAMSVLLDISGGQARVAWQSFDLWTEFGTPVIVAGYIYSPYSGPTFRGGSIRCLELGTGRLQWEHPEVSASGGRTYSLIAADGKLIILDDLGNLSIAEANPASYRAISSCDVFGGEKKTRKFWTPPVLCGGRIYCRNYAGELLCIDVSR